MRPRPSADLGHPTLMWWRRGGPRRRPMPCTSHRDPSLPGSLHRRFRTMFPLGMRWATRFRSALQSPPLTSYSYMVYGGGDTESNRDRAKKYNLASKKALHSRCPLSRLPADDRDPRWRRLRGLIWRTVSPAIYPPVGADRPGHSIRRIAAEIGVGSSTVQRILAAGS